LSPDNLAVTLLHELRMKFLKSWKKKIKEKSNNCFGQPQIKKQQSFFLYYFIIHGYLALLFILLALYKTSAF